MVPASLVSLGLTRSMSRQLLDAVGYLRLAFVAHGVRLPLTTAVPSSSRQELYIHVENVIFRLQKLEGKSTNGVMEYLGDPKVEYFPRPDGTPHKPGQPKELVVVCVKYTADILGSISEV